VQVRGPFPRSPGFLFRPGPQGGRHDDRRSEPPRAALGDFGRRLRLPWGADRRLPDPDQVRRSRRGWVGGWGTRRPSGSRRLRSPCRCRRRGPARSVGPESQSFSKRKSSSWKLLGGRSSQYPLCARNPENGNAHLVILIGPGFSFIGTCLERDRLKSWFKGFTESV
jgi:hypothetical protein